MDNVRLLQAMTEAYIVRRRMDDAFDGIAATQAYWECQPQMSLGQAQEFMVAGKGNGVAGWKIVLRSRLASAAAIRRA